MPKYLCAGLLLFNVMTTTAEDYAYDPAADPTATYQQAIERASQQGKLVLLVFGSEWCPDCRSLNEKMGQAPLSETVGDNFIVAHVDIGNWDKNMGFTVQFGEPVAKGIPSIAIVGADKQLLYVSEAGEFASARSTGLDSLDAWFQDRLALIRGR
ncbi:MAG: thioredoxin family protein [Halieaceae bacterium]|nr:thioredoxin family protein [Halieaceae bacterium]